MWKPLELTHEWGAQSKITTSGPRLEINSAAGFSLPCGNFGAIKIAVTNLNNTESHVNIGESLRLALAPFESREVMIPKNTENTITINTDGLIRYESAKGYQLSGDYFINCTSELMFPRTIQDQYNIGGTVSLRFQKADSVQILPKAEIKDIILKTITPSSGIKLWAKQMYTLVGQQTYVLDKFTPELPIYLEAPAGTKVNLSASCKEIFEHPTIQVWKV